MKDYITVIGGGLAGCEATYQIAKRGIKVKLYEMKPEKYTPAHSNEDLAEVVCSNSFKSNLHTNACGLLKEELRLLDSLLIKCADKTAVPAGQALAVDRKKFSKLVTKKIKEMENVQIIRQEYKEDILKEDGIVIIATGPLTSDIMTQQILKITNQEDLYFYDAAAPIITKESINMKIAFWGSRYQQERGNNEDEEVWRNRVCSIRNESYINLPMNKEEYENFCENLINAQVVTLHEFEKREIFEGCIPIEVMAKRGMDTLRFGPLKPVGFTDLRTGRRPYGVVQLRQDNQEGSLFNMVGFQTNLKFTEQKRVFSIIPGLEKAEFIKYGVMHRNTYIDSSKLLDNTYQLKKNSKIYFAGQITGVEGYVESIASGLVSALNAVRRYKNEDKIIFPKETMIGALSKYISTENKNFQPMNANFGILPSLEEKVKDKKLKYQMLADKSIEKMDIIVKGT